MKRLLLLLLISSALTAQTSFPGPDARLIRGRWVCVDTPTNGYTLSWDAARACWKPFPPAGSWGSITGTLSDQTDLQAALDGKSDTSHNHTGVYEPANANIQGHIATIGNPHGTTAADVGLGNVENTALSTWTGSTYITTLGTIGTGAIPWSLLTDVPASFTPSAHASTHAPDGTDPIIGATGPAGPAGPIGPPGPAGEDGAPGVPGYSPNALLSGGGVSWDTGLTFTVSAAQYIIGNVAYTSPQTDITLSAADVSNPRIDAIVVNSSGQAVAITGEASANPALPAVDPASQLLLSFVYVDTGATTPSNVTKYDVYHENTEWTTARSGTGFTLASTNNPHAGTKDIEATSVTTGNYVTLTAPSPIDPATVNYLVLFIRSKAAWAATRSLQIQWYSGTTAKGSAVVLNERAFTFTSSNTTTYQQIVIPTSLFAANGLSVNVLRITVGGTGTALGFYLDDITLQGGIVQPGASPGMIWKGVWNATVSYSRNDVVTYNGTPYVAVLTNTNSTPSAVNTNWAQIVAYGTTTIDPVNGIATPTIKINPAALAQPTCDVNHRGQIWNPIAGAGVADGALQKCTKLSDDSYAWQSIATVKTKFDMQPYAFTAGLSDGLARAEITTGKYAMGSNTAGRWFRRWGLY